MTLTEKLESLMKTMDWFFEYSDDQRTWRKGHAQHMEIESLLKLVSPTEAADLVQKYVPNEIKQKYLTRNV